MAIEPKVHLGTTGTRAGVAGREIDQGLRAYMLRVYNYMGSALALSGIVAFAIASSEAAQQVVFGTGLMWVFILAPFAFILVMNFGLNKMKASTLQMVFWAFAATMGVSLATVLLAYTGASVARVFFITAGTFGAMSLYGYTTKRDLTGIGNFMIMGLFGIIIAMIVNIFLESSALHFAISVIGVIVFIGLTAYDTQKIRQMYYEADGHEVTQKKAIMGAVTLYLDFINLFFMLMHLLGQRE